MPSYHEWNGDCSHKEARIKKSAAKLKRLPAPGRRSAIQHAPETEAERDVGLGLEDNGEVPGPIKRDPFTANNEQGGKPDMAEGIGSARYEGLQGRQMQNSTTEGFDIVDGDTNVQLKGPLVNKKTGELLSINDQMVEGLADAAIDDATSNVASSRLVVDTLGMTPAQRNSLVSRITDGLANTPHLGKEIIILE